MDKRAIVTPITILFMYGVFLLVWLLFAAEAIQTWGQTAITQHSLTGIEAFGYANINGIVFVTSTLMLIILMRYGGE